MVVVERVVPLHFDPTKNIIVCQRTFDLKALNVRVRDDVYGKPDEHELQPNTIHGMKRNGQKVWTRAIIKFFRNGVPVMQRVDDRGIFDFDSSKMRCRKIRNEMIRNHEPRQHKINYIAVKLYYQDQI